MIDMKAEYEELRREREAMLAFDESIFYPERILYGLGFTDEDIECLENVMRWKVNQGKLHRERKHVVEILRARQVQLSIQRKEELLRELESLTSNSV